MLNLAFITGLQAEARLIKNHPSAPGGGTPPGATQAAETLIAQGATALISFGIAGGLDPTLPPGTLLIPHTVLEDQTLYPCNPELLAFLSGPTPHLLLSGATLAATAAEKSTLHAQTRAHAIDLESGATARAAQAHNLPFAVLRAIADPATRTLPPAATIPLTPTGAINLPAILRSVLIHPTQLPTLIALARDTSRARTALLTHLRRLP